MLSEIQRGSVPREYFQLLSEALTHTTVYEDVAVAELQEVNNPDMIGEVADLLLREENTHWTLCSGLYNNRLLLSLRTDQTANRADKVMKRLVSQGRRRHLSFATARSTSRQEQGTCRHKLREWVKRL